VILIPAAGGPSWADIMTAFGTVGAVVAAVGIALWTEWRSGQRLAAEQATITDAYPSSAPEPAPYS
jgi:hypothetical protein